MKHFAFYRKSLYVDGNIEMPTTLAPEKEPEVKNDEIEKPSASGDEALVNKEKEAPVMNEEQIYQLKTHFKQLAEQTVDNIPVDSIPDLIELVSQFAQKVATPSLPNEAPIKWAKRKSFVIDKIKDNNLRKKLQSQPELEQKLRTCEASNALVFLNIVYGDYINAKLMYQTDLRGSTHNKALDKTLFDRCSDQCRDEEKDINLYLPNVSVRLNKEVKELINFDESNISKDKVKNAKRLITATKNRLKRYDGILEP